MGVGGGGGGGSNFKAESNVCVSYSPRHMEYTNYIKPFVAYVVLECFKAKMNFVEG